MDLDDYQRRAAVYDQFPEGPSRIVVPLLGLAGETGELLSEYKRNLRAQQSHSRFPAVESAPNDIFPQVVREELGDIIWYASNLATKYGLALSEIAEANLEKLGDRYEPRGQYLRFFDERFPERERIPRQFEVLFTEAKVGSRHKILVIRGDGKLLGDELSDNAHGDDGYRYHDVFHFAYATMLGWSPVTRKFMRAKRGSDPVTDEVEDGGRSWVFEEAISLLSFEYARRSNYFIDRDSVDGRLLRDIKSLTAGIEVRIRSRREWELAITKGYEIWRELRANHGGWVRCDLEYRAMNFRPATDAEISNMKLLATKWPKSSARI